MWCLVKSKNKEVERSNIILNNLFQFQSGVTGVPGLIAPSIAVLGHKPETEFVEVQSQLLTIIVSLKSVELARLKRSIVPRSHV